MTADPPHYQAGPQILVKSKLSLFPASTAVNKRLAKTGLTSVLAEL